MGCIRCGSDLVAVCALHSRGAVTVVCFGGMGCIRCGNGIAAHASNSGGAITVVGTGTGYAFHTLNSCTALFVCTNNLVRTVAVGNELGGGVVARGSGMGNSNCCGKGVIELIEVHICTICCCKCNCIGALRRVCSDFICCGKYITILVKGCARKTVVTPNYFTG